MISHLITGKLVFCNFNLLPSILVFQKRKLLEQPRQVLIPRIRTPSLASAVTGKARGLFFWLWAINHAEGICMVWGAEGKERCLISQFFIMPVMLEGLFWAGVGDYFFLPIQQKVFRQFEELLSLFLYLNSSLQLDVIEKGTVNGRCLPLWKA